MQDNPQGTTAPGPVGRDDKYDQVVRKYHRRVHQDRLDGLVSKDVPLEIHMVHIYRVEKEKLSAASCRVYRNALSRFFLARGTAHAVQALEILNGSAPHDPTLHIILKARHATLPRPNNRPSGKRGQPCPPLLLAGFLQVLAAARSKWAAAAVDFYLAGVLTGMRVRAWRTARLMDIEGIPALVLAPMRTCTTATPSAPDLLILRDLTPAQIALVDRHLARLHEHATNEQFSYLFEGCRQLVRDVAQRSIPVAYQIPSLDSARDLFRTPAGLALGQDHALCTLGRDSAAPTDSPPDGDGDDSVLVG